MYQLVFQAISLLGDAEDSFLRQLCMKVQIMLFMPGDYIVKKGDVGSEVMYIYDGDVSRPFNVCITIVKKI